MTKILKSNVRVAMFAYQGAGKTTYIAAVNKIGQKSLVKNCNGKLRITGCTQDWLLKQVAKDIIKGRTIQRPTRTEIDYDYNLNFKSSAYLWHQNVGGLSIHDDRGGRFDCLQDDNFIPDSSFIASLLPHEENTINAILVLFDMRQFSAQPLTKVTGKNKYLTRNKIYAFLKSLRQAVNMPIAIAINHCVDESGEEVSGIPEAKKALESWIADLYRDIDVAFRPRVYFIDSVAALKGDAKWQSNLGYPLLDILVSYIKRADCQERDSGFSGWFGNFAFGRKNNERKVCHDFIASELNQEARKW